MPPEPPLTLDIAPEVTRALGAASVMRLRADPTLSEYVCCICDQPAHARNQQGASVVAIRYTDGLTLARLAHPDCAPSTLLTVIGRPPLRSHTIRATCHLTPDGHPVLQLINDVRAWPRRHARQAADHHTRALTAAGFTTIADTQDAVTPPVVPGLVAHLRVAAQIELQLFLFSVVIFTSTLDLPTGWQEATHRSDRLLVIARTPGSAQLLAATAGASCEHPVRRRQVRSHESHEYRATKNDQRITPSQGIVSRLDLGCTLRSFIRRPRSM